MTLSTKLSLPQKTNKQKNNKIEKGRSSVQAIAHFQYFSSGFQSKADGVKVAPVQEVVIISKATPLQQPRGQMLSHIVNVGLLSSSVKSLCIWNRLSGNELMQVDRLIRK